MWPVASEKLVCPETSKKSCKEAIYGGMREWGYTLTLQNHLTQLSRISTYIVCSVGWNMHVG